MKYNAEEYKQSNRYKNGYKRFKPLNHIGYTKVLFYLGYLVFINENTLRDNLIIPYSVKGRKETIYTPTADDINQVLNDISLEIEYRATLQLQEDNISQALNDIEKAEKILELKRQKLKRILDAKKAGELPTRYINY